MSLSLTTRRRLQTSSTKWTSQQHLAQRDPLLRQHLAQPIRKQRSFIEPTSKLTSYTGTNGRSSYLQRGLSVGRTQDNQRVYNRQILKKQSALIDQQHSNGRKIGDEGSRSIKPESLIRKNIQDCGRVDRPSRSIQAWSSTTSILKSLDKELEQLNGVLGKTKVIKNDIGRAESPTNLVNRQ